MLEAIRRSKCAVLAIALVSALGACGDEGGSGGNGDDGAEGAATAEKLVEKMQAVADADDFSKAIPLIVPEQRAMLSFGMMMAPEMMVGMAKQFAGMGGPEAAGKIEKMEKAWKAVKDKHKIPERDEEPPAGLDLNDKNGMIKFMNDKLGHVDHAAFIKDVVAFLEANEDKDKEQKGGTFDSLKGKLVNLRVDGDKGTVDVEGKDQTVGLVKIGDRWFADISELR